MQKIVCNSVEQTVQLGYKIGLSLKKGDVLCLTGDLGCGKTVMVKGITKAFGVSDLVSSPTFTIVNEYNAQIPIFHFDVYRLEDIDEFYDIGGDEYFDNGICIIEWGEKLPGIFPKDYLQVTINKTADDENTREITMTSHGSRFEGLLDNLAQYQEDKQ